MSDPQIERPSLADAFKGAGSGRAAGLVGILPKTPHPVQAPTADRPGVPGPAPQHPSASAPATRRRVTKTAPMTTAERSTRTRRDTTEHEGVQNVAVYLEPDILTLVRAAKGRSAAAGEPGVTYDELLVDALDHVPVERLSAQFQPAHLDAGAGPLQRRSRRPRGSGGIQIQLRLDGNQRRALDELAADTGAPSRSALVATAYRLYFASSENES